MTATAPASGTLGATASVSVNFTGLTPATKYVGELRYSGVADLATFPPTVVSIDTP